MHINMKNKELSIKTLYLLFLICCCQILYSQDNTITTDENSFNLKFEGKNQKDSISSKTYNELIKIIYSDEINVNLKEKCANIFYRKARTDNKVSRVADAYRNLSYIAYQKGEYSIELAYLDSIIDYTKNKRTWNYPSFAYFLKGLFFDDRRNFKNSLDNFVEAYNYAKRNNNPYLIYDAKYSIGSLKSRLGNYKEALGIYKECLHQIQTMDHRPQDTDNYLIILHALSDSYRRNKKIDSSTIFNRIGIKKTLSSEHTDYYGNFILSEGINHFERRHYLKSIDSITKSLPMFKNIDDSPNIAFANFYLGKNYLQLNQKEKALVHFKKVDSIFQKINDIHPDIRENYEFLIDYYKSINDKDNQLLYIEKLIKVDSILIDNYKYLSKNIALKYDTPELLSRKEKLIENINKEKSVLIKIMLSLVAIVLGIIVLLLFNNRKKKDYKRKFEEILNLSTVKSKVKTIDSTNNKKLNLSTEMVEHILSGLEHFEKNNGYLKQDITITLLAKELNTNTKYLSKVINFDRKKTFSNYINDLRIGYVINKLKNDKKLRKYTIKAISESVGFKNSESFSKAFYKQTGIYPSYFIKELSSKYN